MKLVALLLLASSLRFSLHKTAAPSENIPAGLENLATDKAQNHRSKWKSMGVTSLQPIGALIKNVIGSSCWVIGDHRFCGSAAEPSEPEAGRFNVDVWLCGSS